MDEGLLMGDTTIKETDFNKKQDQNSLIIRREEPRDYRAVEEMVREAFYNLYVPGATEHYLVHTMREHPDFIPELDYVLELHGEVIGNIMYTKAWLEASDGTKKEILTFGPLCVKKGYQRRGLGKKLMECSFSEAVRLGYDTVVIFGSPSNYVSSGFESCKKHQVSAAGGKYPAAMLVRELVPGTLSGKQWVYSDSPVMAVNEEAAARYDAAFPKLEKKHQLSQEEFYILSRSFVE